jgi:hypothetical protein
LAAPNTAAIAAAGKKTLPLQSVARPHCAIKRRSAMQEVKLLKGSIRISGFLLRVICFIQPVQ